MNDINLSVYKTLGYIYNQLGDYKNACKYMNKFIIYYLVMGEKMLV